MKKGAVGDAHSELPLEERALRYLMSRGTTSVQELYEAMSAEDPSLTKAELADLVWQLSKEDKAKLEDVPVKESLSEFLRHWERNLWLYGSLVISFATIIVVYGTSAEVPIKALRWVLGSMFVLFIPGYMMIEALFPRGIKIDSIERFSLSVGLSIVLAMLVGLLLNYTPWGIRLTPILISLMILTIGLDLIALLRKYLFI